MTTSSRTSQGCDRAGASPGRAEASTPASERIPGLQEALGNQALARLLSSREVRVSPPGDPQEKEADRIADAVTSSRLHPTEGRAIQPLSFGLSSLPGLGMGRPLDPAARAMLEPRLGSDFGAVRIHDGPAAAGVAKAVRARAFTLGRDVIFGEGRYAPETAEGTHLLAHELTHVVQQSTGSSGRSLQRKIDATVQSVTEQEAATMGDEELAAAIEAVKKAQGTLSFMTDPDIDGLVANQQTLEREQTKRVKSRTGGIESTKGLKSALEGGSSLQKPGLVQTDAGVDLLSAPDKGGDVLATLPLNTHVFVERQSAGGWYFVAGAAVLMLSSQTRALSPWLMGMPFAIGQLVVAGLLHVAYEDEDEQD